MLGFALTPVGMLGLGLVSIALGAVFFVNSSATTAFEPPTTVFEPPTTIFEPPEYIPLLARNSR